MNFSVIFKATRMLFKTLWSCCKAELVEEIKKGFLEAVEAFKETLWSEIEESVKQVARETVAQVEKFCLSTNFTTKRDMIIDEIVNNIKLPLVAKPFKGLIKKLLKEKLDKIVSDILYGTKEFLA